MENQLLDTQALKNELSDLIPKAKTIVIISAYITEATVVWMLEGINKNTTVCVVARLSPQDFSCGSSTFQAIRMLIDAGHKVNLLSSLHAKIYLIDKSHIFIGSANFTNNGLKLFGSGNIEATIKAPVTTEILKFIDNIQSKSTVITSSILDKMMDMISVDKSTKIPLQWSDDIINSTSCLWTVDMIQEEITNPEIENDADKKLLFGNMDIINFDSAGFYFKQTNVYRWLINELKQEKDNTISFGLLSKKLHNSINDDPIPYRKTIKQYVKNLLSYCKLFALDEIDIMHPNYSEIVKLK